LAETAKQNDGDNGHCVLSPWSEIQYYKMAVCVAWQYTSFWQLCLHWSWHCMLEEEILKHVCSM